MATEKMKKRWKCKYCDGINSRKDLYCVSCGARWSEVKNNSDKEIYPEETQIYPEEEKKENTYVEEPIEKEDEQKSVSDSYKTPKFSSFDADMFIESVGKTIALIAVSSLMIACISYLWQVVEESVKEIENISSYTLEEYEDIDE